MRLNSSLFVQSTFQPGADIFLESPPVRESRRVSCLDYPTDAPPGESDSEFSRGENGPGGVARSSKRIGVTWRLERVHPEVRRC